MKRILILIEETGSSLPAFLLALFAGLIGALYLIEATLTIIVYLLIELIICFVLNLIFNAIFYRISDRCGDVVGILFFIIKIIALTIINYSIYKVAKPDSLGLIVFIFTALWSYAVAYFSHIFALDLFLSKH